MNYDFQIGSAQETMVTLESLGIRNPKESYLDGSLIQLGNKHLKVATLPTADWFWSFMYIEKTELLRVYCPLPNFSSNVFIKTIKYYTAGRTPIYGIFSCIMFYPPAVDYDAGRAKSFGINFIELVEVEDYS